MDKIFLAQAMGRIGAIALWGSLWLLATAGSPAQAQAVLTGAASSAGYTLDTFVSGIPSSGFCCGPVGLINTAGGIMVSDYGNGQIRVFGDTNNQLWSAGALGGTTYSVNNSAGLGSLNGNLYQTLQASGQVLRIDPAGNPIGSNPIATIPYATGIVGDTATNRLYVSTGTGIWQVNPANNSASLFASALADGLAVSPDGSVLYAALTSGSIVGISTGTGLQTFSSNFISGTPDGIAIGSGSLAGNLFVNTNAGQLIEVNIGTLGQTVLVQGGSRGDFVTVDGNNGSLLFTQTDSVLRLTAPSGGGFVSGVPEPETYALLLAGMAILGVAARRRQFL